MSQANSRINDDKKNKRDFSNFGHCYQLVAIDIDGTLLDDRSKISQKTHDALNALKDFGLTITLATGRFYPDALCFAKFLGFSCPMILLHGALIQEQSGEILMKQELPFEVIPKLISIAKQEKVPFQIFQEDRLIMEERTFWNDVYLKFSEVEPIIVPDSLEYLQGKKNSFAFIYLGTPEKMAVLKKIVEHRMGNSVAIACAHPNLLEIVASNVTKGNALTKLASIKNIPLSHTIGIGDSFNDIDMIRIAGLGVAMGNAPQEVKDAADFVTKDNNHDGIAYFISKFLTYHQTK